MNRRKFLKLQMKGALLLAAGGTGALLPGVSAASPSSPATSPGPSAPFGSPDLAVSTGEPGPATRAAVELLGGMGRFVAQGAKVVIKPNMSFANPPEWATTTHPMVVRELAVMCFEAGAASVLVLDNPLRSPQLCMERSGILGACRELGDIVHGVTGSSFYEEVPIPLAEEMNSVRVMRAVMDADVLIAAPVAKSHASTGVSLSLKGMMGLIKNRGMMHWRYDLDRSITDLHSLLRADLAVVDATRILTTNGPYGPGKVVKMDTIIASADPVAADAQTVALGEWYGRRLGPENVAHLRHAHRRGLGRMDIENLRMERVAV
jgi:uncharacterized protein (DUF362 family)